MNYEGEMEGVFREQQREVEERGGFLEAPSSERNNRRHIYDGSARTRRNPDERRGMRFA